MSGTGEWTREAADPCTGTDQMASGQAACLPPAPRCPSLTLNDIHLLACRKWDAAGRPPGDGARFWLEAEQELRQQKGLAER